MLTFLHRTLVQPLIARKRRSPHLRYLRALERSQFDSLDVIQAAQLERLRAMLQHAEATVPFYRNRFAELGLRASDVTSLDALSRYPILTKADLRSHASELRSETFAGQPLTRKATSGSTGVPLEVVVDADAMAWKSAATLRSDAWSGYRRGGRIAKLWGHPPSETSLRSRLRERFVERTQYLNTLDVSDTSLRAFSQSMHRAPPSLLFGHAHSLYLLACFLRREPQYRFTPEGIISAAMMLYPHERTVIEETFGIPVTNRYGCEEVSLIASECERHDGFHIHAEGLIVETVPIPGVSDVGTVVVTDLRNRAMPLIRYRVGDMAALGGEPCPCGRGLPMLRALQGREADYILTPEGKLLSGISLTDHFATLLTGARQVQLVQEAIDLLRVRVVPEPGMPALDAAAFDRLVRHTFGPTLQAKVEFVEALSVGRTGKYRFCISPIAVEFLQSRSKI